MIESLLGPIASLTEVLALPPLKWCIAGILPKNGVALIGGSPKIAKSVNLLQAVLDGVRGRKAWGRFDQAYGNALLINIEGGAQGIKARELMYKDLPAEVHERIHVSGKKFHVTLPSGLVNAGVVAQLIEALKPYDFVCLDPMVSFHAGDENNSQQMVAMMDALRETAVKADCSIMIVHHMRKFGSMQTTKEAKDSGGDMMRGAGGIFGAVDGLVMVWKHTHGNRALTFVPRYAEEFASDYFDEVVLAQDQITKRVYPLVDVGGLHLPDPVGWGLDHGKDFATYGQAFNLAGDAIDAARKVGT